MGRECEGLWESLQREGDEVEGFGILQIWFMSVIQYEKRNSYQIRHVLGGWVDEETDDGGTDVKSVEAVFGFELADWLVLRSC